MCDNEANVQDSCQDSKMPGDTSHPESAAGANAAYLTHPAPHALSERVPVEARLITSSTVLNEGHIRSDVR